MSNHLNILDFNNLHFRLMQTATSFDSLVRLFAQKCNGLTYVVCDGMDSRYPRRLLYPDYKNTTSRANKSVEQFEILRKMKTEGLPKIGGIYVFEKPRLEADDLMAKLAINHVASGGTVTIHTNDADMTQLLVHKGIKIPEAKVPAGCRPDEVRLYKTLVGDSSDKIGGLRLFGNKSWEGLSQSNRAIIELGLVEKDLTGIIKSNLDPKLILRIQENWEILLVFWTIIGFLEVSDAEVIAHMKYYPPVAPKPIVMTMNETGVLT